MSDDIRDQQVREALDGAAGRDEPSFDRLIERVHRRGRARRAVRSTAVVAAVAVFVGAVTWAGFAISGRHERPTPAASISWATAANPAVPLTLRHPSSWHVQQFQNVCMIDVTGLIVANVSDAYQGAATPDGCAWPPPMGHLPADAVVVEFDRYFGGPPSPDGFHATPDTTFPLSLGALAPDTVSPGPPRHSSQRITVGGDPRYQVNVWIGAEASPEDRALAGEVVASIAPNLCPEPSPGLYDPAIDPVSGSAGSSFTVSGETPTVDESGTYVGPTGSIAVWWNADPDSWEQLLVGGRLDDLLAGRTPPPGPGDAVLLGMQDVNGLCRYGLDLTVPAGTSPGTYDLTVLDVGGGGAASLGGLRFTVTP